MKTLLTLQVLLGAMVMAAQVDRTLESQIDRFGRTGGNGGRVVWYGKEKKAPRRHGKTNLQQVAIICHCKLSIFK